MSQMYAYAQPGLAGTATAAVARQVEQSARALGGSVRGRFYPQDSSPVRELWALVEAFDHARDDNVALALRRFAAERGTDLHALLNAPPPTTRLWTLLDALTGPDAGYLLVPSPDHLDGLGVPKSLLLRLISHIAPQLQVVFLNHDPADGRGVVARVDIPATDSAQDIVSVRVRQRLQRAGLADIAAPVDALLAALLTDAIHAGGRNAGPPDQLRIEVLFPPENTTALVDVIETRDRSADPVNRDVQRICALNGTTAHRWRTRDGGTLTRCAVPLPDALHTTAPLPVRSASSIPERR